MPRLLRDLGNTRKTWYILDSKNITRRASPIIIAYHELGNVFGDSVCVTILVSGNWPTRLTLIGVSRKQIEMKQKEKEVKQIETNVDKLMMFIELLIIDCQTTVAKFNALMQTICPKRVSMGFLRCRYN
jgi:hypothetical protein